VIAQPTNWQPDPVCGNRIGLFTYQGVGVPALSNGDNTNTETDCGENPYVDPAKVISTYSYPYQCTEYVRRFYGEAVLDKNTVLAWPKPPGKGYYAAAAKLGLVAFRNAKGTEPPRPGDIISFDGGKIVDPSGHVAIVMSDVNGDAIHGGTLKIIEQNWTVDNAIGTLQVKPRPDGIYEVYRLLKSGKPSGLVVIGWLRKQTATSKVVLFSNFGPGDTYQTGFFQDWSVGGQTIAAAFTPTINTTLATIEVAVVDAGRGSSYFLNVTADNAGVPGVVLESFHSLTFPLPPGGIFKVTSVSQPVLTAGTRYWIVIDYECCVGSEGGAWYWNDQGQILDFLSKGSSDSTWHASFGTEATPAFRVTGN
jgi:hypothetical protein